MTAFENAITAAARATSTSSATSTMPSGCSGSRTWRRRTGDAVADPAHDDAYVWVVVRHEIDYLRPAFEGERVTARTWVGEAPKGARFDRHMEFVGDDGKVRVRARTHWAIIDKAAGRPIRVPPEVVAPFLASGVEGAAWPTRSSTIICALPRPIGCASRSI